MFSLVTPHFFAKDVLELSAARLRGSGISGLLLDLDGTLKDFGADEVPSVVVAWVEALRQEGFKLCLLSNGKTKRIERFARALGVPFVAKAFKPLPFGCRRALAILGLARSQVAVVGDQIFADIVAGRMAGLRTILVPATHAHEPWFTRAKRPFERLVLRWLVKRPSLAGAELAMATTAKTI